MSEQYKFALVDPETCLIEDLEKEVQRLYDLGEYYETKQLALKKFINSVYGATASKFFIAHNTAVAESITLQGQDLNHYSENSVNEYFSGIFQADTELHKKLGITTEQAQQVSIAKGKITDPGPCTGPEFDYLIGDQSLVVAGDTDSILGDTILHLSTHNQITIKDFFTQAKYKNDDVVLKTKNGQEIVPVKNHEILSYVDHDYKASYMPIKYIMRHKVKKQMYKIKTKSGKEIIVTADHSMMVIRNNELISIPTANIDIKTDKVITVG